MTYESMMSDMRPGWPLLVVRQHLIKDPNFPLPHIGGSNVKMEAETGMKQAQAQECQG